MGTNSSGKSTFLRSFPLLKQSINRDLRNAISWYDSGSVDFGDFNTSLNRDAQGEPISFEFIMMKPFSRRFIYYNGYYSDSDGFTKGLSTIRLRIDYNEDNSGTFVQRITIDDSINRYVLLSKRRYSNIEFRVNDLVMDELLTDTRFGRYSHNQVVPSIEYFPKEPDSRLRRGVYELMRDKIRPCLKKYCNRHLTNIGRLDEVIDLWSKEKSVFLERLKSKLSINSFKKNAQNWTIGSPEFVDIYNRIASLHVLPYLEVANAEVTFYYSNCSYIAPVRAEASRYYREQGLQVEDIDPYGKNLQEFISSLNDEMEQSYKKYCQHVLGVFPVITPFSGQNSISLQTSDSVTTNLTDVGFGYSQILPIITKLWYATQAITPTGRFFNDSVLETVLIEQPELHLHPAMQAKIADALIECATQGVKKDNSQGTEVKLPTGILRDSRLIVETHSSSIVNRIGRRIREGKISSKDVSIVLFEKGADGNTQVRQIGYGNDGRLINWPYGFFDPNDD